ncbi:unnamed protein product [Amoebophrya sp. A25]|nr:unnamed protein product [Amoebophrya sp. A25]|eukprot:GSA25T00021128001.1
MAPIDEDIVPDDIAEDIAEENMEEDIYEEEEFEEDEDEAPEEQLENSSMARGNKEDAFAAFAEEEEPEERPSINTEEDNYSAAFVEERNVSSRGEKVALVEVEEDLPVGVETRPRRVWSPPAEGTESPAAPVADEGSPTSPPTTELQQAPEQLENNNEKGEDSCGNKRRVMQMEMKRSGTIAVADEVADYIQTSKEEATQYHGSESAGNKLKKKEAEQQDDGRSASDDVGGSQTSSPYDSRPGGFSEGARPLSPDQQAVEDPGAEEAWRSGALWALDGETYFNNMERRFEQRFVTDKSFLTALKTRTEEFGTVGAIVGSGSPESTKMTTFYGTKTAPGGFDDAAFVDNFPPPPKDQESIRKAISGDESGSSGALMLNEGKNGKTKSSRSTISMFRSIQSVSQALDDARKMVPEQEYFAALKRIQDEEETLHKEFQRQRQAVLALRSGEETRECRLRRKGKARLLGKKAILEGNDGRRQLIVLSSNQKQLLKHPALASVRAFHLLEDFSSAKNYPRMRLPGGDKANRLARWKRMSLESGRRKSVADYEELWEQLELLQSRVNLNYIADFFIEYYLTQTLKKHQLVKELAAREQPAPEPVQLPPGEGAALKQIIETKDTYYSKPLKVMQKAVSGWIRSSRAISKIRGKLGGLKKLQENGGEAITAGGKDANKVVQIGVTVTAADGTATTIPAEEHKGRKSVVLRTNTGRPDSPSVSPRPGSPSQQTRGRASSPSAQGGRPSSPSQANRGKSGSPERSSSAGGRRPGSPKSGSAQNKKNGKFNRSMTVVAHHGDAPSGALQSRPLSPLSGPKVAQVRLTEAQEDFLLRQVVDPQETRDLRVLKLGFVPLNVLGQFVSVYLGMLYPHLNLQNPTFCFTQQSYDQVLDLVFVLSAEEERKSILAVQQGDTHVNLDEYSQVPLEVACVVLEVSRLLWLQSLQGTAALSQPVVEKMRRVYNRQTQQAGSEDGIPFKLFFQSMEAAGFGLSPDEHRVLKNLVLECDLNGDGVTSFPEWLYILQRFTDRKLADALRESNWYARRLECDDLADELIFFMEIELSRMRGLEPGTSMTQFSMADVKEIFKLLGLSNLPGCMQDFEKITQKLFYSFDAEGRPSFQETFSKAEVLRVIAEALWQELKGEKVPVYDATMEDNIYFKHKQDETDGNAAVLHRLGDKHVTTDRAAAVRRLRQQREKQAGGKRKRMLDTEELVVEDLVAPSFRREMEEAENKKKSEQLRKMSILVTELHQWIERLDRPGAYVGDELQQWLRKRWVLSAEQTKAAMKHYAGRRDYIYARMQYQTRKTHAQAAQNAGQAVASQTQMVTTTEQTQGLLGNIHRQLLGGAEPTAPQVAEESNGNAGSARNANGSAEGADAGAAVATA